MNPYLALNLVITPRDGALLAELRPLSRRETSTRLLALATVGLRTQTARGSDLWLPSAQTLGLPVHPEQIAVRKRLRIPSTESVAVSLSDLPAGISPSHVFIAWCRLGLWAERRWIASTQAAPVLQASDPDHLISPSPGPAVERQKLDKETQASMLGMLQKGLIL